MANTRNSRVHESYWEIGEKYRKEFRKRLGMQPSWPVVSKHMAETFQKMIDVNGFPSIHTKRKRVGRRKVNTVNVFWEFKI